MKYYIKYIVQKIIWILFHFFQVFPIKNNCIIFESYSGKQIACNPLYIYRYLKEHYPDIRMIWVVKKGVNSKECKQYISHNSLLYWYYLLTSKAFITNNSPQGYLPFRKNQLRINTWHGGGAYKKVGVSVSRNKHIYKTGEMIAASTTHVIASCKAFENAFYQGYLIDYSKYLKIGMPRNDIFFNNDKMILASNRVRSTFKISEDDFVVLYAPTWRNSFENPMFHFTLDCNKLTTAIKHKYAINNVILLFRGHHLLKELLEEQSAVCPSVLNVSSYPDMQELLCTANMLISDYSSVVWDYSFTYRPCFLFVPDLQEYKNDQGYYTPIEGWGFPMAKTNEELAEKIQSFDINNYYKAIKLHHKKLGSYENGKSTQSFCDFLINKIS